MCVCSHASGVVSESELSAEDMPYLSMTKGLLIGGVMKWEEFLQIERSEQNHTHRDYPSKSTQHPIPNSSALCPEGGGHWKAENWH